MADKSINRSIRIFVNGKEVEHSLNNVRKEMFRLQREVNGLERGTDEYVKKSAELRRVRKYFNDIRTEITGLPTLFDKLSKSASGLVAIFGLSIGIESFFSNIQKLMEMAAELSDMQANVQKTTGMSRKEIKALTKDLDELNTRTSRTDLLAIAEEGGRIGIPKEEIAAFTKEMDKANVALGDSFDSVEDVAGSLGKLRALYKETREQDVSTAFNSIGSAINDLGAAGVASEKNVADFATRVGALPDAFKPSIADALALGAAFEESGVDAEVAGRSYGIIIQTAAKNAKAFADVMGVSKDEVESLINTNPVEFFLQFTKSVSALDKDGVKTAKMLDALGIGADGVNKIIGAAASGNDRFRETLELANQSMADGTSLTNEFNTKNENLAATIEKIKKEIHEWYTDERLVEWITNAVNWIAKFIGVSDDAGSSAAQWRHNIVQLIKVLTVIISAVGSYNAALMLTAQWSRTNALATALYTAAQRIATVSLYAHRIAILAVELALSLFTLNLNRARAAWIAFSVVAKMNPFTLIASAVVAATVAIIVFGKESQKANAVMKATLEIQNQVNDATAEHKAKVQQLISVIKSNTSSIDQKNAALAQLKRMTDGYLDSLTLENSLTAEGTRLIERYIQHIDKLAQAKALVDYKTKLYSEQIAAQNKQQALETELKGTTATGSGLGDDGTLFGFDVGRNQRVIKTEIAAASEENKFIGIQIGEIDKRQKEQINKLQSRILSNTVIAGMLQEDTEQWKEINQNILSDTKALNILLGLGEATPSDTRGTEEFKGTIPEKEDKKGKSEAEKELERRKRIAEELIRIQLDNAKELLSAKRKAQDAELELMEDGFEKERQKLAYEFERRIEDLQIEISERKRLQEELIKSSVFEDGKGNKKAAEEFRLLAAEQEGIIAEKEATITSIEQTHLIKRQQLKFEYSKKEFEEKQKAYERELMNLETRHNNELKAAKNLEDAKKLLREQYGYSDEELSKLKDFEKAKGEITLAQQKEIFEKQKAQLETQISQLQGVMALDAKMENTLLGSLFTEEQRQQVLAFIDELKNELSKLEEPGKQSAEETKQKDKDAKSSLLSGIDLLGFTADDWVTAFDALKTAETKLQKLAAVSNLVKMGFDSMTNALGQFYDAQNTKIQNDLQVYEASINRKKTALANQLEQGVISQETYNAKVAKLEADLEKKRAEAEYKQAMNEWKMQMIQAVGSMALGILNSLSYGGPVGIAFAAITAALGAFQIATLASSKPKKPSYATGGATVGLGYRDESGHEVAGTVHANEYVIPEYLRSDPVIARMEEFIEARRRGMMPNNSRPDDGGYADGGVVRPVSTPAQNPEANNTSVVLLSAINRLNDNLEYLADHPIEAKLSRTLETAKVLLDDQEEYKNHRNKNKR